MTFEQIMAQEGFVANPEQASVIQATLNTVVSAGAGAGKTAVLSWRFLRLVMEKGVRPDQILTLTFTKKAASEMRERIYKRLLKAKDSLPESTLDDFNKATISTLDSFCLQIVKADCISYGLPRDISNLSDMDLKAMVERLALQFLSDPENEVLCCAIAENLLPNEVLEKFFMLIAYNTSLCGNYDAQRIYESFHAHIKTLYEKRYEELVRQFDRLGGERLTPGLRSQYEFLRSRLENQCFLEKEYFNLKGIKDPEIKAIVNEGIVPILGNSSVPTGYVALQDLALKDGLYVPHLQHAVERFANLLNQEKRRLGCLTFNDIASLSVAILRDNLNMRRIYKERFRFIMIDEFQDNNSLQRDLLFLLSEDNSKTGSSGIVPKVEDLEMEKLFFVGDEKQSIYRFRGADVSVFRALQEEIGRRGSCLTLKRNHRSQAKLLEHFEDVFENVMGKAQQSYEASFDSIESFRTETGAKIVFATYDKNKVDQSAFETPGILEAEAIGEYCQRILNTDEFLVDGERPKPEDIAILFATASNQMNIEKALKKRNLEYQIAETRSLMLDSVSSDFYSYINCLLYPESDRRSLVSLYRSPFCGLCEMSIRNLLVENSEVLDIDRRRFEAFENKFNEIKKIAFRLTIAQLLEKLYTECGYKAFLESSPERESFKEHYEYIYSYAVQFDAEGRGLADFARFMRNELGKAAKLPETSVLHPKTAGIQIMTVHKSKGLEFKVVIYCGLGDKSKGDSNDFVFKYHDELISTEQKGVLKVLEYDKKLKEEAEKKRVMYVAMTRAMDHLILIGGYKVKKSGDLDTGSVFNWYVSAIGWDAESNIARNKNVILEDVSALSPSLVMQSPKQEELSYDNHTFKSQADRMSVTDLKSQAHGASEEGGTVLPTYEADSIVAGKGLQDRFGTLCHFALEMLLKTGSTESVQCNISESEAENRIMLEQANAFARAFTGSEFFTKYVKDHRTEEEIRFYTASDDKSMAIEGVIDLLVHGKDYNLVVDYKTDSVKNPQEHKIQVQTYVKVAQQLYGKTCYGVLFYLRDGSISEVWDSNGNKVALM